MWGQATRPGAGNAEIATPPTRPARNPGELMERAESGAQVYVDDSFASMDRLRAASRFASQGQSQNAINEYQAIINNFGQKLVYLDDNSYVSITDYVRERLLQLPAVRQGMYDQLYGGEAQKAVDAAVTGHDAATLIRVCDRYFPSAAAFSGLQQAAEWYFERGEFLAASRTWQTLLMHPLAGKQMPELLFRGALAESLAQNAASAKVLRERLAREFPDATGTLFGEEVKLLAKLDELAAAAAWDAAGVDLAREDYPAFGGGPARAKLLDVNAAIGARLWSAPMDGASELAVLEASRVQRNVGLVRPVRATGETEGPALSSFSVMANGTLFVHGGNRLMALSANAGAQQWSYPPQPTARNVAPELLARYGNTPRAAAHDAPFVFGDSVFAVMPAAGSSGANLESGWVDPRAAYGVNTSVPYSRVVSLNRETGAERWSTSANDVKLESGPAEAEGTRVRSRGAFSFVGSPIVTRQGVYVMARRVTDASFAQQYLVRLDRETGEVTWACYLCSTSSGSMYGNPYFSLGSIPVPTLVDDVLYISTGQGADCAVDANIGRILWLRVIDSGTTRTAADFYAANYVNTPAWKFNPPVVVGDRMIVADNQTLRVYDRWNGRVLNTINTARNPGALPSRIEVMSGPVDSQLVLTGADRRTVMVPLKEFEKPAEEIRATWLLEAPSDAGRPQGRPFLTASAYYLPFEKKLIHINLKSGTREAWDWPNTEKDVPGKPGNLLVTSEQVVVVTDSEIAGYSKWETARDNRLARIAKNPKDPKAYLDLAEISFRTSHHDEARENMRKSVELANEQGNTSGSGEAAETLARLYRTNLNFGEQLLGKEEPELRDRSRFYYEQCRSAAREPEQQAEWRLRLAELALKQKRPEEAATLYNEVLVDPALRVANYRETEVLASAGATAEQRMRKLMGDTGGAALYRRFEDQAEALLAKARAGRDLPGLQQVMEGFPNSKASVAAATDLATAYAEKKEWQNARKVLWWLVPRTQGDKAAHQRAIADLVKVSLGLKKYASAAAWAARGANQFKESSFATSTGESTTFIALRKQVAEEAAAAGGNGALSQIEGRLPKWHGNPIEQPPMEMGPLDDANVLVGNLLAPVESSLAYRKPNLLFLQKGTDLRVYDTVKGELAFPVVKLPKRDNCVLLGVSGKTAVFLSGDTAMGLNLETQRIWSRVLRAVPPAPGGGDAQAAMVAELQGVENIRIVGGGQLVVGGRVFIAGPDGSVIDAEGNPAPRSVLQGGGDAEMVRRAAFLSLPNARFTTARLLNNMLLMIGGNQLSAIDVETGEPAWRDRDNRAVTVTLPAGRPAAMVGNEDVVVVQIDGSASTFLTLDADTGQARRTIRLKDDRAQWRALGDDGSLFVVSDGAVASYDLIGGSMASGGTGPEGAAPFWRRTDIQTRYASATALTLDGLVLVDNTLNVWCLSLESGEMRWSSAPRLPLGTSLGTIQALRSQVDGENVIFQASQSSAAFRSMPTGDDQRAWEGRYPQETPMLQSIQLTDPFVIELAMGALSNNQNAVRIIFRDRKGGKLTHAQEVTAVRSGAAGAPRPAGAGDRMGPMLRAWQVLDGGIALQVGDETHFWRNKAK